MLCDPFLVVVQVVVFFFGVFALAGLGGEGSSFCRSLGGAAGGPGRHRVGWKKGGVGGGSCGRVRSATSYSVARRRMTLAAVYDLWWLLFADGWWYGGVGGV